MKRFLLLLFIPVLFFASCKKDKVPPFDPVLQAKVDDAAIKTYLAAHPDIVATKDSSGLYTQILDPGAGTHPNPTTTVTIDLDAQLLDGMSVAHNTDFDTKLNNLILGWQYGLAKIGAGGSVLLIVPSGLAYGPFAADNTPPNSVLVCTLKLKSLTNN